MRITWAIDDEYLGESKPQHIIIPDDELADCETDEEREKLIKDRVQEDFNQKISWRITRWNNDRRLF